MYFKDKEDFYFYILKKYLIQLYQELLNDIDSCQGDFISAFSKIQEKLVKKCLKKEQNLFQKVFLNMQFTTEKKFILKPPNDVIQKNYQELLRHIDRTLYNYEEDSALLDAFSLVMLITMNSVIDTLMNPENRIREKENYHRRLEIVRSGILRKEKKNV